MTEPVNEPEYVDDLLAALVQMGQGTLKRLGFHGTVVVNIEWTNDPSEGWMCIGSKIPVSATPLLAASLRQSASEVSEGAKVAEICEHAGHDWEDAGGGLEICGNCEAERWA